MKTNQPRAAYNAAMDQDPTAPTLLALYPTLAQWAPELHLWPHLEAPKGTVLFEENSPCVGFPLVVSGEVRVSRGSSGGRELELYRVSPGELCLVSAASLFAHQGLGGKGVATRDTTLALLPPATFQTALHHTPFRDYVLGLFAARMGDLTGLIDAIAFQKLDSRLAAALLGHGAVLHTTHQALADELGTVREIVTRLLHRFEREGWVGLSRETITIADPAALRHLAQQRG